MSDAESLRFVYVRNLNLDRPVGGFAAQPPPSLRRRAERTRREVLQCVVDTAIAADLRFVLISGLVCDPWECPSNASFFRQQCARLAEHGIGVIWLRSLAHAESCERPWPTFLALSDNVQIVKLTNGIATNVTIQDCPTIRLIQGESIEPFESGSDRGWSECVTLGLANDSTDGQGLSAKSPAVELVLQLANPTDDGDAACEVITRTTDNEWQTECVETNAVRFQSIELGEYRNIEHLSERLTTRLNAECNFEQTNGRDRLLCIDLIVQSSSNLDQRSSSVLLDDLRLLIETLHPTVWINSLQTRESASSLASTAGLFDEVQRRFSSADTRLLPSTLVTDGRLDRNVLDGLHLDWVAVQESAVSTAQSRVNHSDHGSTSTATPAGGSHNTDSVEQVA